jgi:hypothetical protein
MASDAWTTGESVDQQLAERTVEGQDEDHAHSAIYSGTCVCRENLKRQNWKAPPTRTLQC